MADKSFCHLFLESNPYILINITSLLHLKDIVKVDSAICTSRYRTSFISHLSDTMFDTKLYATENYLRWLGKRSISVDTLWIEKGSHVSGGTILYALEGRYHRLTQFKCYSLPHEYNERRVGVEAVLRGSSLKKLSLNIPVILAHEDLMTLSNGFESLLSLSVSFMVSPSYIHLSDVDLVQALSSAINLMNLHLSYVELFSMEQAVNMCLNCPNLVEMCFTSSVLTDEVVASIIVNQRRLRMLCFSYCNVEDVEFEDILTTVMPMNNTVTTNNRRLIITYLDNWAHDFNKFSSLSPSFVPSIIIKAYIEITNAEAEMSEFSTLIYKSESIQAYMKEQAEELLFISFS